eukprot:Lithocolla_globosa_v1_NODE_599_length_3623_cov_13.493554.p1 type:complete len:371 gc:universal NODE_599_length_3623_cov_13.493554:2370-3482(+)
MSVYGLKYQARALTAQAAETEKTRFFVGSLSLKHDNELHLLEFNEEENEIQSQVFQHEKEIWSISSSNFFPDLLFTCFTEVSGSEASIKASLWRIPDYSSDTIFEDKSVPLESLITLEGHVGNVKDVLWHPEEKNRVSSLDENHVRIWDINASNFQECTTGLPISIPGRSSKLTAGCWNPHSPTQIGTSNDTIIRGWDVRSLKPTFTIEQAHSILVRDIDFNPNKPHMLASAGDDCKIKFWDDRNLGQGPLREVKNHSHWIWKAKFNRFYDQLMLSSSSDTKVNLECMVSLSSANLDSSNTDNQGEEEEEEDPDKPKQTDRLINTYDQHDDSVYALAWSVADPWIFSSLSYDGRLVINQVPREEKYRIIL